MFARRLTLVYASERAATNRPKIAILTFLTFRYWFRMCIDTATDRELQN